MRLLVLDGNAATADLEDRVSGWAADLGCEATLFHVTDQADAISRIEEFEGHGLVIQPGPGALRAMADAISESGLPAVEVMAGDEDEHETEGAPSAISDVCVYTIFGRGIIGFQHAMRHLISRAAMPFETVAYGTHDDQVGDLRRGNREIGRAGGAFALFVHGGLWLRRHGRDSTERLAIDMTRRGFDTWNLEYRRLGSDGGWPASGEDLQTAFDSIPELGQSYERIVVISHSAGSQLAMWAAERTETPIDLHIAVGPLVDLGAAVANDDVGAAECQTILDGGAPELSLPRDVPTVLVHGLHDQIVPIERSRTVAERGQLELHEPDTDHFEVLDPTSETWKWIVDRVEEER